MEDAPSFFCAVVTDLTGQKRNEAMVASERLARSILDQAAEAIVVCDMSGRVVRASQSAQTLGGRNPLGQLFECAFPLQLADGKPFSLFQAGCQEEMHALDVKLEREGQTAHLLLSAGPLVGAQNEQLGWVISLTDITARKQAEEHLKMALEEKEALLREVHHRVKNNLQAIIYLINMRIERLEDAPTRQFLKELQEQARTIALVYEQLYQSETLAQVDMGPYLRRLASSVLRAFGAERNIELSVEATSLSLDVEVAMPCGLIVNELTTNALKHAFPPTFQGAARVRVELRREGETCTLLVSDNGVGLPPDLDRRGGETMGLHLVKLWATHQLGGSLNLVSPPGTTIQIIFSEPRGRRSANDR